jgi:hypothetical protein
MGLNYLLRYTTATEAYSTPVRNNTLKNELFKDMIFTDIDQVKEAINKAVMFYNVISKF